MSLVYARGPAMDVQGEPSRGNRREMRVIRNEIAKPHPILATIAAQFLIFLILRVLVKQSTVSP